MSISYSKSTSCGNKRKFDTRDQAKSAIDTMRAKGKLIGVVNIYRCEYCLGIHFGHPRIKWNSY